MPFTCKKPDSDRSAVTIRLTDLGRWRDWVTTKVATSAAVTCSRSRPRSAVARLAKKGQQSLFRTRLRRLAPQAEPPPAAAAIPAAAAAPGR